ncbi:hypothetical protein ACWDR2_13400 [Streptomyces sp. NPDC003631]|jgi:hypothetical protein|nr:MULTISPECIES: hypothetical protein [unclassified Streptomyces]TFV32764.1 hypothetical protein E4K10_24815 [Streptomyces sp. T1317-0309]
MVIFVVPPEGPGDRLQVTMAAPGLSKGGLDELHAARNSQDASSQRSESEAWIDDEEGSIDVHRGRGFPQVLRDNEGLHRER